jgi:hypothetical protein
VTLKTSLIITGDSSVAQKEIDALRAQIERLTKAEADARNGGAALAQTQRDQADAAASAVASTDELADAQRRLAEAEKEVSDATGAASDALATMDGQESALTGTGAALALSQQSAAGALGKVAEEAQRQGKATGDAAAAAGILSAATKGAGVSADQLAVATGKLSGVTTAATRQQQDLGAAGRQSVTVQGQLSGALSTTTNAAQAATTATIQFADGQQIATTSSRVLAIATGQLEGTLNATAVGMTQLKTVSGQLTPSVAALGVQTGALAPAADRASTGFGGLITRLGQAGAAKAALSAAGGILAGVLGGVLTGGLSLVVAGAAGMAMELLSSASAAKDADDASASLAGRVSDLGTIFDLTTGKIREQNVALREREMLLRSNKAQDLRDEADAARKTRQTYLSDARSLTGEIIGYRNPTTFTAGGGPSPIRGAKAPNVASLYDGTQSDQQIFSGLRGIAMGKGEEAKIARQMLESYGETIDSLRKASQLEREVQALLTGVLPKGMRSPPPAPRTVRPPSGGRAPVGRGVPDTKATSDAAAAQRQLLQDLDAVQRQFDPVAKAAADYAEELERIARLEAAFDPAKAGSGGGIDKATADRYRAAAQAVRDQRVADAQRTPEAKAADDARKSIDDLVGSLRGEIAVRRELDPVQAKMIGHLAQLAALPEEERKAAEATLRAYYAEIDTLDRVAEAARDAAFAKRMLQDAALDALDAIIVGGEKAANVVKRLAQQMASAALEASLFGTGPLAMMLKGGIAPPPANAAGGAVAGVANQAAADVIGKSVGKTVGDRLDGLFGSKSSFGTRLMANAGIGYAAGSLSGGSGIAGALGGALGGELAGKFLSGLGGFAGPLGSIAGGLLGGVVGKLFMPKARPGGATVSSVGGEAGVSGSVGSDKAGIAAGSSLGGSVASTINQIVDRLGGALGSFSVQIGQYKDDLRVNVNGRPLGGVKGSGATGFGQDQNAAINFAAAQAIAQGAVQGVSDAVAKALRSSSNVESALKEALKVQEIELLLGGIGAQIDKAFRDFEATAAERVRIARAYGFDLVAIEKRNGEDRNKLADQLMKSQVGSLQSLIDEMTSGSLFEGNALERIAAINIEIAKAQTDLDAGVEGAGDRLAQLLEQRLGASRDAYGTTSGYSADRQATLDQARAAVAAANARIMAARGEQSSDPALATTNAALNENNDQNAQIIAGLRDLNVGIGTLGVSIHAIGRDFSPRYLAAY